MYDLFLNASSQQFGQIHFPEFNYLKMAYLRELANIEDYYHNRVYAVKSNHFLCNLLNHLSVPMQYEIGQYVNVATTRAPYLANAMKMTHALSSGQLFNGVFYGQGCQEILLSEDSYFDPTFAEKNWERICAVKVILHPKTDLNLLLPNGKHSSSDQGLAVISVNIPLLAVQYRSFVLAQQLKIQDENGMLGLSHFVHMYVLPNMLYSHIDIVIMNRLQNLFNGAPMGEPYLKHPFMVYDYRQKVDNVLKKVLQTFESRTFFTEQMLRSIPSVANETIQQALMLPDIAPTRQVQWALVLSRLSILDNLVQLMGEHNLAKNRHDLNRLQKVLKRLQHEQVYPAVLPADLTYDVETTIDRIMAL